MTTGDGGTLKGAGPAWSGVLWERRVLALMWLVWAGWVCLLSIHAFDAALSLAMRGLPPEVHAVFRVITVAGLGKWYLWPLGLGAAGLGAAAAVLPGQERARRYRQWAWLLLFAFLAVLLSGLAVDVIKVVAGRARPKFLELGGFYGFLPINFRADYQSFPSGHAATAASVALVVTYLWFELRWLAWAYALPIIASRVVINAHFLGDVIGGVAIALFVTWALRDWFAGHDVVFAFGEDGLIRRQSPTPLPVGSPPPVGRGFAQGR
ncbi:MAG: phosphatase PAP2 family protein [Rhodospirillaceae bacterium]